MCGFYPIRPNKHVCMLASNEIIQQFPVNEFVRVDAICPRCSPVFLSFTSTKQRIKCLAQGHITVPQASLKPTTPLSQA